MPVTSFLNYFRHLGVSEEEDRELVRQKFRAALFVNHPDKALSSTKNATELTILLNEGYKIFMDENSLGAWKFEHRRSLTTYFSRSSSKKSMPSSMFIPKNYLASLNSEDDWWNKERIGTWLSIEKKRIVEDTKKAQEAHENAERLKREREESKKAKRAAKEGASKAKSKVPKTVTKKACKSLNTPRRAPTEDVPAVGRSKKPAVKPKSSKAPVIPREVKYNIAEPQTAESKEGKLKAKRMSQHSSTSKKAKRAKIQEQIMQDNMVCSGSAEEWQKAQQKRKNQQNKNQSSEEHASPATADTSKRNSASGRDSARNSVDIEFETAAQSAQQKQQGSDTNQSGLKSYPDNMRLTRSITFKHNARPGMYGNVEDQFGSISLTAMASGRKRSAQEAFEPPRGIEERIRVPY